jgi:hypothetical protein
VVDVTVDLHQLILGWLSVRSDIYGGPASGELRRWAAADTVAVAWTPDSNDEGRSGRHWEWAHTYIVQASWAVGLWSRHRVVRRNANIDDAVDRAIVVLYGGGARPKLA